MADFCTQAIMLRRIPYGDYDLILTLLTPEHGKISAFARSARKDGRRYQGAAIEPFSVIRASMKTGRSRLPALTEAVLVDPLAALRTDVLKTAYASYWGELVDAESEENAPSPGGYALLYEALTALDGDKIGTTILNLLFQLKFARLAGFFPALNRCRSCRTPLDTVCSRQTVIDIASGTMVCANCVSTEIRRSYRMSVGTIKALLWLDKAGISDAPRIRLTQESIEECVRFFEAFIPHHLGRHPRSLAFLDHIRNRREKGRMYHVG